MHIAYISLSSKNEDKFMKQLFYSITLQFLQIRIETYRYFISPCLSTKRMIYLNETTTCIFKCLIIRFQGNMGQVKQVKTSKLSYHAK